VVLEMALNRYTPVPPISSSHDVTDSNIDTELKEEMEQWKQRIATLQNEENYDDMVRNSEL